MRVRVNQLSEGMMIERDVYSSEGIYIVPALTPVTANVIEKLKTYRIFDVNIVTDKPAEAPALAEDTSEWVLDTAPDKISVKERVEFSTLAEDCENVTKRMKSSFVNILSGDCTDMDIQLLLQAGTNICRHNKKNVGFLDMMLALKEKGDDTYMHSVNVGLISAMLGRWLKWSEEDCELLAQCGLFHDIGKMMIPNSILKKTDKLTDEEYAIIKKHPEEGHRLIKDLDINPVIKSVTLLHHEKCNGKGYPFGKTREELDRFVKVVMIADAYEAMTGNRAHRKGICPFEVVRQFERDGFHTYEIPYLLTFLKNSVSVYIKSNVTLNDGRQGTVVMINDRDLANPVVKIGREFVDLSKEPDLFIESVEE